MLVIDASTVLDLLLRTKRAGMIERKIFRRSETLHAPHLLDLEVIQVLRRYAGRNMTDDRASLALQDFIDLPITRYPHDVFAWRIWELRKNLTAYDAVYIALAEALDVPLVTCDAKLASSTSHLARVELI